MRDEELRTLVTDSWEELGRGSVACERKVLTTPLKAFGTPLGPVSLAVDVHGRRHLLLPVPTRTKLRSGLDGPVLSLSRRVLEDERYRTTYADLACLRGNFDELFAKLCADVLVALEEHPGQALKQMYRVLDRWKALFVHDRSPLSGEQLLGLFGELTVLEQLLAEDPSAHRLWLGPTGHHHDFSSSRHAVEVKSGTGPRRPRIHGLDQLQAPPEGSLHVTWIQAKTEGAGTRPITELVERVLAACDDENALRNSLALLGYSEADSERYRSYRFAVSEQLWYRVESDFPGLTERALREAGIAVTATEVEYTVDLSGRQPSPVDDAEVGGVIAALLQEVT